MIMRTYRIAMAALGILTLLALGADSARGGQILYGGTGSNGVAGHLLILNQSTGAVITDVGAFVDASGNKYGMTGMAFDPSTGFLYGSTANASPTAAAHLVRIDTATGNVTDVGSFFSSRSATMSDITFDRTTGILYGWHAAGDHSLYTINTATGAATKVGTFSRSDFGGGGLAANSSGTIYSTPDGISASSPTLRTVDKVTGATTVVGSLTAFPINAMDFNSADVLYGVQTDNGAPAATNLVTIDTATGTATILGASADNLDAIAFQRENSVVPEPTSLTLLAIGAIGLFGCGWRARRASKNALPLVE